MAMKRKLVAAVVALALCLGLCALSASAASFPDIGDPETARNAEILRLMGVLEGDQLGYFHPEDGLTRAQFCKMSVVLLGKRADSARYASRTIFPDVRATHWSAPFVNFAAASDSAFIHGMPDGSFAPDSPITFGQAVTILMRLLGYEDKDAGAIWPDGYLKLAQASGVSNGLSLGGSDAITRAQAAKLFVNTLYAKMKSGAAYWSKLGTLSDETVLLSVEKTGRMVTEQKSEGYSTVTALDGSMFTGMRGRVLVDSAGRALSFLPSESGSGSPITDAAVILSSDGSTKQFETLSGGRTIEAIYRNGVRVSASALRKYDVAGFSLLDNSIHVCNTRLRVYYEDCTPSPAAPARIQVMGGTSLNVLPTAQQSLSRFKPGDELILLLTADGRVAGAQGLNEGAGYNAVAYVSSETSAVLICGETLIPLGMKNAALTDYVGQAVLLYQTSPKHLDAEKLSRQYSLQKLVSGVSGALDVSAKTLGGVAVDERAMILENGKRTYLSAMKGVYGSETLQYARRGEGGTVDLIVLTSESGEGVFYGRAIITLEDSGDGFLGTLRMMALETGSKTYPKYQCGVDVQTGDFVRAEIRNGRYASVTKLTELKQVPASAWLGSSTVMVDGQLYAVPLNVPCYNRDGEKWMSGLAAAKSYDGTLDLCVDGDTVRIVIAGG